jgi:hypothetical protein
LAFDQSFGDEFDYRSMLANKIGSLAAQASFVTVENIIANERRAPNRAGPNQTGGRAFPIHPVSDFLALENETFRFGAGKKSNGEGLCSLGL